MQHAARLEHTWWLPQIKLRVEKTKEDLEAERKRADLLASLNSFYD